MCRLLVIYNDILYIINNIYNNNSKYYIIPLGSNLRLSSYKLFPEFNSLRMVGI